MMQRKVNDLVTIGEIEIILRDLEIQQSLYHSFNQALNFIRCNFIVIHIQYFVALDFAKVLFCCLTLDAVLCFYPELQQMPNGNMSSQLQ